MEWDQRIAVIATMQRYGGSFVKALANAWGCADEDNSARIEATWPEYIQKYSAMVEKEPK